ncbi:hypothetical protein PROPEN_03703 [Proteus penneri ATCC 35198]|nr:hypothetical protein PROPEN_03703 [Proteus penneri ATCC 35198]
MKIFTFVPYFYNKKLYIKLVTKRIFNKNRLSFNDMKEQSTILNKDKRAEDNFSPFFNFIL